MDQLHRRFGAEQVRLLYKRYDEGQMTRSEVLEILEIGKTRFFALLRNYRKDPDNFTIQYERCTQPRLNETTECAIKQELLREKELVEDERLSITSYNYSAVRDRLRKSDIQVSVPTIIKRARQLDCYKAQRKHRAHAREMVTTVADISAPLVSACRRKVDADHLHR